MRNQKRSSSGIYKEQGLKELIPFENSEEGLALNMLGIAYEKGWGVDIDLNRSYDFYRKAVELGNLNAYTNMAYFLRENPNFALNKFEIFELFHEVALTGDHNAQYEVAGIYYYGEGIEKDLREAVNWYHLAAEQGNYLAQYNLGIIYLGIIYYSGNGVERDFAEAMHWYKLSAEQDYSLAQYMVGYLYYNGEGVEQDFEETRRWYKLAAEQGDSYAQYGLGRLYHNGEGVERDFAEAMHWYKLSAEQDYNLAQ